jgi:hypothetical protein
VRPAGAGKRGRAPGTEVPGNDRAPYERGKDDPRLAPGVLKKDSQAGCLGTAMTHEPGSSDACRIQLATSFSSSPGAPGSAWMWKSQLDAFTPIPSPWKGEWGWCLGRLIPRAALRWPWAILFCPLSGANGCGVSRQAIADRVKV